MDSSSDSSPVIEGTNSGDTTETENTDSRGPVVAHPKTNATETASASGDDPAVATAEDPTTKDAVSMTSTTSPAPRKRAVFELRTNPAKYASRMLALQPIAKDPVLTTPAGSTGGKIPAKTTSPTPKNSSVPTTTKEPNMKDAVAAPARSTDGKVPAKASSPAPKHQSVATEPVASPADSIGGKILAKATSTGSKNSSVVSTSVEPVTKEPAAAPAGEVPAKTTTTSLQISSVGKAMDGAGSIQNQPAKFAGESRWQASAGTSSPKEADQVPATEQYKKSIATTTNSESVGNQPGNRLQASASSTFSKNAPPDSATARQSSGVTAATNNINSVGSILNQPEPAKLSGVNSSQALPVPATVQTQTNSDAATVTTSGSIRHQPVKPSGENRAQPAAGTTFPKKAAPAPAAVQQSTGSSVAAVANVNTSLQNQSAKPSGVNYSQTAPSTTSSTKDPPVPATGEQNSSVATVTVPGDAEKIQNQSAKPSVENRSQANASSTLPNQAPPAPAMAQPQHHVARVQPQPPYPVQHMQHHPPQGIFYSHGVAYVMAPVMAMPHPHHAPHPHPQHLHVRPPMPMMPYPHPQRQPHQPFYHNTAPAMATRPTPAASVPTSNGNPIQSNRAERKPAPKPSAAPQKRTIKLVQPVEREDMFQPLAAQQDDYYLHNDEVLVEEDPLPVQMGRYAQAFAKKARLPPAASLRIHPVEPRSIGGIQDQVHSTQSSCRCKGTDGKKVSSRRSKTGSACLKLYCDCFATGSYCNEYCRCSAACYNNAAEANVKSRTQAIVEALRADPHAFRHIHYTIAEQQKEHRARLAKAEARAAQLRRHTVDSSVDGSDSKSRKRNNSFEEIAVNDSHVLANKPPKEVLTMQLPPSYYTAPLKVHDESTILTGLSFSLTHPRNRKGKPKSSKKKHLYHDLMLSPSKNLHQKDTAAAGRANENSNKNSGSKRQRTGPTGLEVFWKDQTDRLDTVFELARSECDPTAKPQPDTLASNSQYPEAVKVVKALVPQLKEEIDGLKAVAGAAKSDILASFFKEKKLKQVAGGDNAVAYYYGSPDSATAAQFECEEELAPIQLADSLAEESKLKELTIFAAQDTAILQETARIIRRTARELCERRIEKEKS